MEGVTISGKHKIVVLPGDGIGPEVTAEAVKVLKATNIDLEFLDCSVGGGEYLEGGDPLPPDALEAVNEVLAEGEVRTPDIGGSSHTWEVGDTIAERVMEMEAERREYRSHISLIRDTMATMDSPPVADKSMFSK